MGLLTFVGAVIGASIIIAVLLHFWPRYGSVTKAVEQSDHFLAQMDASPTPHE